MVSGINLLHVPQLTSFFSIYSCQFSTSKYIFTFVKLEIERNKNFRGQIDSQEEKRRQVLWQTSTKTMEIDHFRSRPR